MYKLYMYMRLCVWLRGIYQDIIAYPEGATFSTTQISAIVQHVPAIDGNTYRHVVVWHKWFRGCPETEEHNFI